MWIKREHIIVVARAEITKTCPELVIQRDVSTQECSSPKDPDSPAWVLYKYLEMLALQTAARIEWQVKQCNGISNVSVITHCISPRK